MGSMSLVTAKKDEYPEPNLFALAADVFYD